MDFVTMVVQADSFANQDLSRVRRSLDLGHLVLALRLLRVVERGALLLVLHVVCRVRFGAVSRLIGRDVVLLLVHHASLRHTSSLLML